MSVLVPRVLVSCDPPTLPCVERTTRPTKTLLYEPLPIKAVWWFMSRPARPKWES